MKWKGNRKIGDIDLVQRNQTDHRKTSRSSEIPFFYPITFKNYFLIDRYSVKTTERNGEGGRKGARSSEVARYLLPSILSAGRRIVRGRVAVRKSYSDIREVQDACTGKQQTLITVINPV